jgi:hypothetical protein
MIVDFLAYLADVLRDGRLELFPDDNTNILEDYRDVWLENIAKFLDSKLIKWVEAQNGAKINGWFHHLRNFCECGLIVMLCILLLAFTASLAFSLPLS